jgi:hypothetical protein
LFWEPVAARRPVFGFSGHYVGEKATFARNCLPLHAFPY